MMDTLTRLMVGRGALLIDIHGKQISIVKIYALYR